MRRGKSILNGGLLNCSPNPPTLRAPHPSCAYCPSKPTVTALGLPCSKPETGTLEPTLQRQRGVQIQAQPYSHSSPLLPSLSASVGKENV